MCVRVKKDLVGGMNECLLVYLDNVCNVWLRFSFGLEYDGFVVGEVYRPRMLRKGFHLEVLKTRSMHVPRMVVGCLWSYEMPRREYLDAMYCMFQFDSIM